MTHPTIEAMARAMVTEYTNAEEDETVLFMRLKAVKSAARALLTAEPSEAEVKAHAKFLCQRYSTLINVANLSWDRLGPAQRSSWRRDALVAIKASRAALLKEMGI